MTSKAKLKKGMHPQASTTAWAWKNLDLQQEYPAYDDFSFQFSSF